MKGREKRTIRGFYGKALLDEIVVDIMADLQLEYLDKWILFTYEKLLPCTTEVRLGNTVTVKTPCPEIQVLADKILGRLDKARILEGIIKKECNVRIDHCILTINH